MSERRDSEGRLHHRSAAPKAPTKVLKYDPTDMELRCDEVPRSFGDNHRKALAKQRRESSEPQALALYHLEERVPDKSYHEEEKVSLVRAGETVLETFYGMFYACDDETKEWKLAVDEFIPLCFMQERGNANKPFKVIAVSGTTRLMEFSVTKDTKCAQNKAFVKWNEGIMNMYGVRFAKESQANQFYSALCRMRSTLIKTAELFKQPERKTMVSQISDPKTSGVPYSKTSLIVKLPNKETTVMSVPGLLTMSELFDLICKKESLNPVEHQLSLPRIGNKELTYKSDTVLGSVKIREVSIIYVGMASDSAEVSRGTSSAKVESLLEDEHEKGKQLNITLPNGQQRSLVVPINMPVRNLETYICKKENLNPRYHSLQSNDFKHQCFDAACAVGEIEFSELRLLDKRGLSSRGKLIKNSSSDDSCISNSSRTNLSAGLKANRLYSSQGSLNVEEKKTKEKDRKTSSGSLELATVGETSSASKDANSSKSSYGVKPPDPPHPYNARPSQATKLNDSLESNELKSSHSFLEYGEKQPKGATREHIMREGAKTKRKAPRPPRPPQPSPRPTKKETEQIQAPSQPTAEKRCVTVGSSSNIQFPNASLQHRHSKKRPAPTRPPAPKPLSPKSSESNTTEENLTGEGAKHHDRPPPIFCPPPPPDDAPPPLDECEHPVSPLSDDELHEATWSSCFDNAEVNGYPEEAQSPRTEQDSIKPETRQPPVATTRREKPDRPARPVAPPRQSSLPSTPTSPDRPLMSPESIPLKFLLPTPEKRPESSARDLQEDEQDDESSRINFDGDSRSSSIDISSFPESEMPVLSPLEGYKPFSVEPPLEFGEEDSLETVAETKFAKQRPEELTLPPPLVFSKSDSLELNPKLSLSNDSGDVEYSGTESDVTIEEMVIPPPPVLPDSDVSPKEEKMESISQIDEINSIPPPMDFASPPKEFANPPAEFADSESTSAKPLKKKLGLDASSFPWLTEPQPSFNAEVVNTKPDVERNVMKSPVDQRLTEVNDDRVDYTIIGDKEVIPDEVKEPPSDLSVKEEMKYDSSSEIEVQEPLVHESQQKAALESEPITTGTSADVYENYLPEEETESYKTPFDDLENVNHSAEDPDEGFDDFHDPVLESLVNRDLDTGIKRVNELKSAYGLDLTESADSSPPTPPLTSPPGSGYVSPTLPSPLCSPREDTRPGPVPSSESVPAKSESDKIEKSNVVSSVDVTKSNESPSSFSESVCSTEHIELPNPPPITLPPLRRYSDLAADVSFSTSGLKNDTEGPTSKERNKENVSNKAEVESHGKQSSSGYKRPVTSSSAFKTQSWADIKNREKELEEERKKNTTHSKPREPPPPSLVFRNLNRSSATAIRPKSFSPILPSMYKIPESSRQTDSLMDTKTDSCGSEQAESTGPALPSLEREVSSAALEGYGDEVKSCKKDILESAKNKPVVIVPSSSPVETKTKSVEPAKHKPVIIPSPSHVDTKTAIESTKHKPVVIPSPSHVDTKTAIESTKHRPVVVVPSSSPVDTKTNSIEPTKHQPVIVPSPSPVDTKTKAMDPAKHKLFNVPNPSQEVTSAKAEEPRRNRPVVIVPALPTANAKSKADEPAKQRPFVIVPSLPTVDTVVDTKDDKVTSSSSQSTTKVLMRKKNDKPNMEEKRKSVQDMMSMFGSSKESRRNSNEGIPQQGPAMRSLEEKVTRSNKQYGVKTLVDTLSAKPGTNEPKHESKREPETVESLEKPIENSKAKDEGSKGQRVYKILLANDKEKPASAAGKEKDTKKAETKKEDPKANEPNSRSNSLNPRQTYNVLFPKKNEELNSSKTTKSSSLSHESKEIAASSLDSSASHAPASVRAKKVEGKSPDALVSLQERESSKPIDPFKRRSMPVCVIDKNDTRQPSQATGNLKILMATQITDVDVVPRGTVAAMKAAWKKEGN